MASIRYPGARTDSESWIYIMNFSKELNDEWVWKERFPTQPEVEEYLNHVADRFDMRKDIEFRTRVPTVHWNESKGLWDITTDKGDSYTSRYFVSASGVLSAGRRLPFDGVEKFKGEVSRQCAITGGHFATSLACQRLKLSVDCRADSSSCSGIKLLTGRGRRMPTLKASESQSWALVQQPYKSSPS